MSVHDDTYLKVGRAILKQGESKADRTGVGTTSLFGPQMTFRFADGFPLLTSKRVFWKGVTAELEWFLKGYTNVRWLQEQGVHIWDDWVKEGGDLGPIYGCQWRGWPVPMWITDTDYEEEPVDQMTQAQDLLRDDPDNRRIIVSAWNVGEMDYMALPPCHLLFQFYSQPTIDGHRALWCKLYQRSADWFLGVPFNIASYSLLTHILASTTGHLPGGLIWTGGDCHIYRNHELQIKEQMYRQGTDPRPAPQLHLPRYGCFTEFRWQDAAVTNYNPHPPIKGKVAV